MAEGRTQRRLAAVFAADVAGYSRLMGADEEGTLARLRVLRRDLLDPKIEEHRGRIVKTTGDGLLAEFGSVVDALRCALEVQRGMPGCDAEVDPEKRIAFRIGINVGDIVVEGGDIYGDGVNVAARLEGIAEPGGICVSARVQEDARGKLDLAFEDLGEQRLKNIAWPVKVYRVQLEGEMSAPPPTLALPDKPSIAVLPFENMSADPEHAYFADGLTEDLITDLSQVPGLFVIARNSSFTYKAKSVDVRSIARNLGVRYILEGSARRAVGRVRINVQLIDAIGGGHLWAERFDRGLDDVFKVQDEVTAKIVEALVGRLTLARTPERKRPTNLEAYDLCVRGRALLFQSGQAAREARLMFQRAIALDPEFAEAHRWIALTLLDSWLLWGEPLEPNLQMAVAAAQKAVMLDPNDAGNHWVYGLLLTREHQLAEAETEFAVALKLDPNNADTWAMLSELMVLSGRPNDALANIEKALRLNPHPPGWYYWFLGQSQYLDRQYDRAVLTLRREETYRLACRRTLAAALAQLGRPEEARWEAEMFMVSNPHFTIHHWVESQRFWDEAACQHFVDGYRKAGLPE
jgi:TolB-like protein